MNALEMSLRLENKLTRFIKYIPPSSNHVKTSSIKLTIKILRYYESKHTIYRRMWGPLSNIGFFSCSILMLIIFDYSINDLLN